MSRNPRQCAGGVVYHVLNRANGRLQIFKTRKDYEAFEEVLLESLSRVPIRLCGHCIMPNHWHLVLWPREDGELSSFMQWLTLTHTQRWHAAHGTTGIGHVYQGRYKSFPVQSDNHYLTVVAYVESNPLRGSLTDDACKWPFSSLHIRLGQNRRIPLSEGPVALPGNWPQFANKLPGRVIAEKLAASIRRNSPYGSDAWVSDTATRLGLQATLRPMGRPRKHPSGTPERNGT